jgi:CBS domain-containing protein
VDEIAATRDERSNAESSGEEDRSTEPAVHDTNGQVEPDRGREEKGKSVPSSVSGDTLDDATSPAGGSSNVQERGKSVEDKETTGYKMEPVEDYSFIENNEPVEKYMVRNIPTVWDKTPLSVAYSISHNFDFKSVIALNDESKASGILTETDFINESQIVGEQEVHNSSVSTEGDKWTWNSQSVMYILKNKLKFSDKLVKDVSGDKLVSVTRKTSVKECANLLKKHNIEQVPVLNMSDEPIGLVRSSDLMRAMIE